MISPQNIVHNKKQHHMPLEIKAWFGQAQRCDEDKSVDGISTPLLGILCPTAIWITIWIIELHILSSAVPYWQDLVIYFIRSLQCVMMFFQIFFMYYFNDINSIIPFQTNVITKNMLFLREIVSVFLMMIYITQAEYHILPYNRRHRPTPILSFNSTCLSIPQFPTLQDMLMIGQLIMTYHGLTKC